jgi:hypothetical protein
VKEGSEIDGVRLALPSIMQFVQFAVLALCVVGGATHKGAVSPSWEDERPLASPGVASLGLLPLIVPPIGVPILSGPRGSFSLPSLSAFVMVKEDIMNVQTNLS